MSPRFTGCLNGSLALWQVSHFPIGQAAEVDRVFGEIGWKTDVGRAES